MNEFTDKWEKSNTSNTHGLPYITDKKRKLFYRFNEAKINPIGSPLLIILHGHGTKSATRFQHEHWNVLAPIDHFGYQNNGSWWLGENGDFFIKELLQKLIKKISKKYECQNNIYFYGSSMGGYGAIYHGILSNARAVYANVPQIKFTHSRYFESFQQHAKYIFGKESPLPAENNLLDLLNTQNKFPIFFLCENMIEEKDHLKNYLSEHTLSFLRKCYEYQIKTHIEILPQEGHTKNYGINEVLSKFEKFAQPLKETKCMELKKVLTQDSVWFLNTNEIVKPIENKLLLKDIGLEKPLYLIYGNKKIRQEQPSKNLLKISGVKKLYLKISIMIPLEVDGSVFIQLYSQEALIESTKHKISTGDNTIDIQKLHPSISHLKVMFRFSSTTQKAFDITIKKIDLCIEEFSTITKPPIQANQKSNLIPNVHHIILNKNYKLTEKESTYETKVENTNFNFYLNYHPGKKLIVALPGATDRNKPFYNFQRYSWSQNIHHSFMSLLDPTIQENNKLTIGWFQGTYDNYALQKLVTLLKKIFSQNNIREEDVVFFGSSAGGFSSLKIADAFPSSTIAVINPQTYVYNYSKKVYEMLLDYSYPNKTKKETIEQYNDRLSVNIDLSKRTAPIFYYQNIADNHHTDKHLKPYLDTIDKKYIQSVSQEQLIIAHKKIYVLKYNDPESGHSPPNKEKTLHMLNDILDNKIKEGYRWIF